MANASDLDEPPSRNSADKSAIQSESSEPKIGLFGRMTKRISSGLRPRSSEQSLRDKLEDMLDEPTVLDDAELGIERDQHNMLLNIVRLDDLTAEDVAVPRADIKAIDAAASFEEIIAQFREHQHSRMPVYRENMDDIIGFLHLKDVFGGIDKQDDFKLEAALHDPLIVSPAMQVSMLLLRMRLNRVHMALVVDEYGGIDGLVTIEDLVEQIVGEIEDEHDDLSDNPAISRYKDEWRADARATIEDFEAMLGETLDLEENEDEIETLGGLVMSLAGSVPSLGEVLVHEASGLEFRVTGADPRRVLKLVVKRGASPA